VPELGTVKAKHVPRVVLTSNNARELSDALKRRCLHLYIDYPTRERELAIVRARLPDAPAKLAEQVVAAVAKLRTLELKKSPSISETLDWVQALVLLNADTLSADLVAQTLNLVLKHEADVEKARPQIHALAAADRG
jgi:MoxR-like ATPase